MNRERIGKLLTLRDSGANSPLGLGAKSKAFRDVRPDGGVVTQRTANPLPLADFRDSSHNSPSVPRISFQGLSGLGANAAQADTHGNRRDVKQARPARVGSAVGLPMRPDSPSSQQEMFMRTDSGRDPATHEPRRNVDCGSALRVGIRRKERNSRERMAAD
jgi:hypothetical protein